MPYLLPFFIYLTLAPLNEKIREQRSASALLNEQPQIEEVYVNGQLKWQLGQTEPLPLKPKDKVILTGSGFGMGPDIDFSKILLGNIRIMERTLPMYEGKINIRDQLFYETSRLEAKWPKEILSWDPNRIEFTVPDTGIAGPLVISVQKRIGEQPSLQDPGKPHIVSDPLTERITKNFTHPTDVISTLSEARLSPPIAITIQNSDWERQRQIGEMIFWGYDFNIGQVHELKGAQWDKILSGKAIDPVTGQVADPEKLIGAHRAKPGEAPVIAFKAIYFDPYPIPTPIPGILRPPLYSGHTFPTGFIGRTKAESIHPIFQTKQKWAGENCASCHTQKITYEIGAGKSTTRFFPGLPNAQWSIKWATLGPIDGVKAEERGRDGKLATVDKTQLLYHLPSGATENALIRVKGEGSRYDNDQLYAPVAIPSITRHTPLRRALARTEMIAGFEGSYIHSEEPDGAVGAMSPWALKALTVYMSTLDNDRELLKRIGMYRWLKENGMLAQVENVKEWEFIKTGWKSYPKLQAPLERGKMIFAQRCESCHASNFETWTDENMIPLTETGTFFSPSIFHRETQSIRTSYIEDLYWMQPRGLLHDGHVKSITDLIDPARCDEKSSLYRNYYTLHSGSFKIPKGTKAQETAIRHQAYFVDVPGDSNHLYWDYQKMRREFGKIEFGLKQPAPLPAAPHPWCAETADDVLPLSLFLLTL